MKKITDFKKVTRFEEIPNIGKIVASDFRAVGLQNPSDLKKEKPLDLYNKISSKRGSRQDPCMLDVCMAAIDFMKGNEPHSWWFYTAERKKKYPNV